jgi:hypothetical protein
MNFLRLIQGTPQPQADLTRTILTELKSRVVDAYYTSGIGIKQALEYGNTYQAEFSGVDVSKER